MQWSEDHSRHQNEVRISLTKTPLQLHVIDLFHFYLICGHLWSWHIIACTTDDIKLWLHVSLCAKQCQNTCSAPPPPPPVYQDLTRCHDWLVEKAIVNLPIRIKTNFNTPPVIHWVCWVARTRISMLLHKRYKTEIKLRLWRRLRTWKWSI